MAMLCLFVYLAIGLGAYKCATMPKDHHLNRPWNWR